MNWYGIPNSHTYLPLILNAQACTNTTTYLCRPACPLSSVKSKKSSPYFLLIPSPLSQQLILISAISLHAYTRKDTQRPISYQLAHYCPLLLSPPYSPLFNLFWVFVCLEGHPQFHPGQYNVSTHFCITLHSTFILSHRVHIFLLLYPFCTTTTTTVSHMCSNEVWSWIR